MIAQRGLAVQCKTYRGQRVAAYRSPHERQLDEAQTRKEVAVDERDVMRDVKMHVSHQPTCREERRELPEIVVGPDAASPAFPEARPVRQVGVAES